MQRERDDIVGVAAQMIQENASMVMEEYRSHLRSLRKPENPQNLARASIWRIDPKTGQSFIRFDGFNASWWGEAFGSLSELKIERKGDPVYLLSACINASTILEQLYLDNRVDQDTFKQFQRSVPAESAVLISRWRTLVRKTEQYFEQQNFRSPVNVVVRGECYLFSTPFLYIYDPLVAAMSTTWKCL
jgi:hypothetical protein